MMKPSPYIRLTVIGIAMLGTGSVLADDLPLPADPAQLREQMRSMSSEDRTAQREQMRETSVDGRTRMEKRQSAQGDGKRRGGGEGGGYGQGYESRRGDGSGGGRGMGGGRHR